MADSARVFQINVDFVLPALDYSFTESRVESHLEMLRTCRGV